MYKIKYTKFFDLYETVYLHNYVSLLYITVWGKNNLARNIGILVIEIAEKKHLKHFKKGLKLYLLQTALLDPVKSSDLCKVNAFPQMIVNETTTQAVLQGA